VKNAGRLAWRERAVWLLLIVCLSAAGLLIGMHVNRQESNLPVVAETNTDAWSHSRRLWFDALCAGEDVGLYCKTDFDCIAKMAERIPSSFHYQFYDGLAHGLPWPFEDLDACLQMISRHVPAAYQEMMRFGPIQEMAKTYGDAPEKINAYLAELPSEFQPHVNKGVSIGLLRYYMRNLPAAVPVILQLDESLHDACFEELGWWLGEQHQADLEAVRAVLREIPDKYHHEVYHGYIRGVQIIDEIEPYEDLIAKIEPEFHEVCYQALGWKICNWNWMNADEIESLLKTIKRQDMLPAVRRELEFPARSATSHGSPPPQSENK